jgi:molybdate transport system ATP-binding protein
LRYASGFELDVAFATVAPVTALFGPSGSGKTSVLSVIAGLRTPSAGRVALGDRLLFDSRSGIHLAPEARRVSYVFQSHLLFPHLNVRQNLLYGWRRRPRNAQAVDFERVVEVMELGDALDRWPHTLSGGQRQRVAVGRALLYGPELLLLDEPLASLDQALKERVMEYVEHIVEEWRIPTVYVTHDAAEVRRLAGWVVALRDGRVQATGSAGEVLKEYEPRPLGSGAGTAP